MENHTNHSDSSNSLHIPLKNHFMIFAYPGYQKSPSLVDSQPPSFNEAALSPHIYVQSLIDYAAQQLCQILYWTPGCVDTQT